MRKQAWLAMAGVLVAGVVGIAQSDEIATAESFDAAMKDVGKNFGGVRSGMEARDGEAVSGGAENLVAIFERVEAFFAARELEIGVTAAGEARQAASDLVSALENQAFDQLQGARDRIGATCRTCHTEYREQVEDGGYRIKDGVL
jgi:cytochrome c556